MIPAVAAVVTLLVVGCLLLLVFAWLRSTSHTHSVLLDVLLAAAPGCWLASSGAATIYNEKLDVSAAELRPLQVSFAEAHKARHGMNYYLTVENWPDPRGERRVEIDQQLFAWMQQGGCITVTWRHGRLG